MTIIIKLTNRIFWKKDDSVATITDGQVTTTYESKKLAQWVAENFKKNGKEVFYDGDRMIVEKYDGLKEKEIFTIIKAQIDSAIARKMAMQKLSYTVQEL